ncbi:MAG TPA: efflux RND transporter permease subunit [Sedimentisphaerales bacterium]|nr:efflux RND transporter permease subunit [Sedimentisphaerales bacterium]
MKLANFSVSKPVTTVMIFVAIIVLGIVSMLSLGIDLMPELEIPAVSVITGYEGAGAREVENMVTTRIEDALSTIGGVDTVTSTSRDGISMVTLQFGWGEELDEKINDIREKIDGVKAVLPQEADTPMIFKFDLAAGPILIIVVTADKLYPDLQKIVDDKVVDPLKRVKGVAAASARGGLTRQIRVDLDRARLSAMRISVGEINASLASQNLSLPGGGLDMGHMSYLIRTPEEFTSAEQIAETVIAVRGQNVVRLRDVATVRDFFRDKTYGVSINRQLGMGIMVQKQSGESTVAVAERVRAEIEKIRQTLPPDLGIKVVMDESEFILASVANLRNTVLWAVFFVFLVILFFLRDLRASLIVCTSIPVSLIITFILMKLADYTINTNTLASLAVAVGMVVDNAIVVVDNISRHRDRGHGRKEGAIYGTNEVGTAVLASTLTTICIFAPIVFVGGIAAVVFGEFASVVTMALVASLLTAVMLVPMLSSKFLKVRSREEARIKILDTFYDMGERTLERIEGIYVRVLLWVLNNRKTVLASCGILLVWAAAVAFFVGTEFFPTQDENRISVTYELPVGMRHEQTEEVARQLEDIAFANVPELRDCFLRWGVYGDAGDPFGARETSYSGFMFMSLIGKTERDASPDDIIARIRPLADRIPGAQIRLSAEDPVMGLIFGGGQEISIEIYGDDLDVAAAYAGRVQEAISRVEGVQDVEISRRQAKPELKVMVDRQKASSMGISIQTIGRTIETLFSGTTATKYREGGEEYDVVVRLRNEDRTRIEDLRDIYIMSASGQPVSLSNVARIEHGYGPTQIERKDQARFITVRASFVSNGGRQLSDAVSDIRNVLNRMPVPEGFSWVFGGAEEERRTAFTLLFAAALLGMVLVYMVMASQFESYRDPFIIFLSVPFGLVGVIFGLFVSGQTLSVISFIATITLIGVVVNNGIVLISYIGILRQRNLGIYEAIIQGGKSRLRPVLATTITTILGLTPLLLARGEGSEIWVPFAATIIGGLTVGTGVTLVLMPALYSIFEGAKPIGKEAELKL